MQNNNERKEKKDCIDVRGKKSPSIKKTWEKTWEKKAKIYGKEFNLIPLVNWVNKLGELSSLKFSMCILVCIKRTKLPFLLVFFHFLYKLRLL